MLTSPICLMDARGTSFVENCLSTLLCTAFIRSSHQFLHRDHEHYSGMSDPVIPRKTSHFWLCYYPSHVEALSPAHEPCDCVLFSSAYLLFFLLFPQHLCP